jgi:stage V sporulation protein S
MEILKVSGKSVPKSVAGAIAQVLRREPTAILQAVGPDAINQAVKSIAIARSYLEDDRLDIATYPSFEKIEIEGMVRTAIKFQMDRKEKE